MRILKKNRIFLSLTAVLVAFNIAIAMPSFAQDLPDNGEGEGAACKRRVCAYPGDPNPSCELCGSPPMCWCCGEPC